jgi:hypothetical protein
VAELKLGRLEAEEGELPPLCLRCGQPAEVYCPQKLSAQPGWTYCLLLFTFWPFLILMPLVRRNARILAPLCTTHKNYWRRRRLPAIGSVAAVLLVLFILYLVIDGLDLIESPFILMWMMFWLAGLLWLGRTALLFLNALCALEINEDELTLNGVSPRFVLCIQAEKGAPPTDRAEPGPQHPRLRVNSRPKPSKERTP